MPLTLDEKVRLLSRLEMEKLAHLASDTTYEQGEDLRTRQEGSGKLYVLKEGRVQLFVAPERRGGHAHRG